MLKQNCEKINLVLYCANHEYLFVSFVSLLLYSKMRTKSHDCGYTVRRGERKW